LIVPWPARLPFNDVHVGQAQRRQVAHHVLKQGLRRVVVGVVGGRDRRQPDAHPLGPDGVGHGLHHVKQQAGAVLDGAAIRIGALVAATPQELVEQVAVGRMHFDAIKPRGHCPVAGLPVGLHNAWHLVQSECPWHRCVDEAAHPLAVLFDVNEGFGLRLEGRGRDGRCTARLQAVVRYTTHMPQLHHDAPASGMHGVGHGFPGLHLFVAVQSGGIGVAMAFGADRRGLADDEAGPMLRMCPLRVVRGHQRGGHLPGRTVARQRRHHDAMGQGPWAHLNRIEQ